LQDLVKIINESPNLNKVFYSPQKLPNKYHQI